MREILTSSVSAIIYSVIIATLIIVVLEQRKKIKWFRETMLKSHVIRVAEAHMVLAIPVYDFLATGESELIYQLFEKRLQELTSINEELDKKIQDALSELPKSEMKLN